MSNPINSKQLPTATVPADAMPPVQQNYTGPVLASIAFAVVLLAFTSFLKYRIDKRNKQVDYWNYYLEFPIDVGSILISVLVVFNYLVSDVQYLMIALIVELLGMSKSMSLRNVAIETLTDDNINIKDLRTTLIKESLFVVIPALITFVIILW